MSSKERVLPTYPASQATASRPREVPRKTAFSFIGLVSIGIEGFLYLFGAVLAIMFFKASFGAAISGYPVAIVDLMTWQTYLLLQASFAVFSVAAGLLIHHARDIASK